jgi:hypothetical protein
MAGRGPTPKDPRDRARRNQGSIPMQVVDVPPTPQPPLPDTMPGGDLWPEITQEWWAMWARSSLTREFCDLDWADLLDCAVLHGIFWSGNIKASGELRLRLKKHGVTREDRAKLRILDAHPAVGRRWDVVTHQWI